MQTYITLDGQTVTYPDPTPDVAAFLGRVELALIDPNVSWGDFLTLTHGLENPIMDTTFVPGLAMVTNKNCDNPILKILSDMLNRKQILLGKLNWDATVAAYTVDVATAAKELNLTEDEVIAAITRKELGAIKRGEHWMLRPNSLDSYRFLKSKAEPRATPVKV
jgi:hypothetical protein